MIQNDGKSPERLIFLAGARIFGLVFSFLIPMYLGRHLEVETYGTYKQVMLIFWFSQIALNFGFDDSVNYFLRWDRKNFSLYALNALIFNFVATSLLALGLSLYRVEIAALLNNPDLAQYIPLLGLLIVVSISSAQVEGFLINLNRFKARLYLDAGTEFLKSVAILAGFLFFHSITVALIFLVFLMVLRFVWMVSILHSHKVEQGVRYKDAGGFFKAQAKFGVPLGVSRIIQNILNMENLFVSSFFSVVQFTYYSVGCFENPLINSVRASLYELVNIDLVDNVKNKDFTKAAETWRQMNRTLFLIVIPFTVYMTFFAKEIIVFIFSDKYLASVPFFMLFNLYVAVTCLNPEPLFRATSNTGTALKIKVFGVVMGLLLIIGGAYWFGPMAVLIGKIIAVAFINISGLIMGARFIQNKARNLFVWRDLVLALALSTVLSALIKYIFIDYNWHPFWILAASFSVYFSVMFVSGVKTGLIKTHEVEYVQKFVLKIVRKLNPIKGRAYNG
ncbi:lipopolysaccharide biosynthesis protein [Bdellovibrio bacteriovorus]